MGGKLGPGERAHLGAAMRSAWNVCRLIALSRRLLMKKARKIRAERITRERTTARAMMADEGGWEEVAPEEDGEAVGGGVAIVLRIAVDVGL